MADNSNKANGSSQPQTAPAGPQTAIAVWRVLALLELLVEADGRGVGRASFAPRDAAGSSASHVHGLVARLARLPLLPLVGGGWAAPASPALVLTPRFSELLLRASQAAEPGAAETDVDVAVSGKGQAASLHKEGAQMTTEQRQQQGGEPYASFSAATVGAASPACVSLSGLLHQDREQDEGDVYEDIGTGSSEASCLPPAMQVVDVDGELSSVWHADAQHRALAWSVAS